MDRSQRRAVNRFLESADHKRQEAERLRLEAETEFARKANRKKRLVESGLMYLAIIIIAAIVGMLNGCKSVKNTTKQSEVTETAKIDSIASNVTESNDVAEKTETKPESKLHITAPINVDSNGKVQDGEYRVNTGNDSLILVFKNNLVDVRSNCGKQVNYWKSEVHKRDSLLSIKRDSSYSSDKKKEQTKETIIEVTPRWMIWTVSIETLLIISFLIIKFRKYIP